MQLKRLNSILQILSIIYMYLHDHCIHVVRVYIYTVHCNHVSTLYMTTVIMYVIMYIYCTLLSCVTYTVIMYIHVYMYMYIYMYMLFTTRLHQGSTCTA